MAANDDIEFDSILREQSLFQVYRSAPSFFSNIFNGCLFGIIALGLAAFALVHSFNPHIRQRYVISFADLFNGWANAGISLAATILGFLIAGFTVLCTVLRPSTMIALHRLIDPVYKQSRLKLLFSDFVQVTVYYLTLLLVSVAALLVGGKDGPAAVAGDCLGKVSWWIPYFSLHIIFEAWALLFIVAVLQLKSFIYNVYTSLILGLSDAADDHLRAEAERKKASAR